MSVQSFRATNPQQALGVFLALAGFDFAERETKAQALFHRLHPSVVNDQYAILRDETNDQFIAAAAWYVCAPAYAALVLNETRPITAAEARSGEAPSGSAVIWHTMLTPYGETQKVHGLLRQEIIRITQMPTRAPLYQTFKSVKKNYSLIQLERAVADTSQTGLNQEI